MKYKKIGILSIVIGISEITYILFQIPSIRDYPTSFHPYIYAGIVLLFGTINLLYGLTMLLKPKKSLLIESVVFLVLSSLFSVFFLILLNNLLVPKIN